MRIAPLFAMLALAPTVALAEAVTFQAADGVTVHGDYRGDGAGPMIVLFHQAGSNLHEYDPIAPELNAAGFDTLAVDQRSGGQAYGAVNQTAKAAGGDYLAAYADLEAALAWASAKQGGAIVWGSSYSAALVFRLAADHPGDVRAVLSFSPGEYFGDGHFVRDAAAGVTQPVFVSSASDAGEISAAQAIAAAVAGPVTQLAPQRATHGSSALRSDQNPDGAAEVWASVNTFLAPLR